VPSTHPASASATGCGRELSTAAPQAQAPPEPQIPEQLAAKIRAGAGAIEGERKQVTVLFADVVGSMELAAQAGPEAWRGIMERLFSLCCDAVLRYEGTVDKFTGDGIMVLFGAPIAHEDHAQRGRRRRWRERETGPPRAPSPVPRDRYSAQVAARPPLA
jgi:class 3 adenylate cyclase